MKKLLLALFFTILTSSSSALFDDFNYSSDGTTLVCLNIDSTNIDRYADIEYNKLWGISTIEKLIVHLNSSRVLITAYTPNKINGDYYGIYGGGVFDIVNKSNDIPYIEFENEYKVKTDKKNKKIKRTGRLNRFTGDIHIGHIYGPCKKIERIFQ